MNTWYKTLTKSHLDRILSVFAQNKIVMSEVIVPIQNNGHFGRIVVILPSVERANGELFIYDHLDKGVNENNLRKNMVDKIHWYLL